jgi:cytochrome c-type biogenesis protein CcmH/NrfF
MIYLLLFLIPIVALLVWAARVDRKRRRRETQAHDIGAAARTTRRDAQRKSTEWGAGA